MPDDISITVTINRDLALQRFTSRLRNFNGQPNANSRMLGISDTDIARAVKMPPNEILVLFDRLWQAHHGTITTVVERLRTFIAKHGKFLSSEIPRVTGIAWPTNEITIFPSTITWAGTQGKLIGIGVAPENFVMLFLEPVTIHELIHANVAAHKPHNLHFPHDAEEIADTLLVNRITTRLNHDTRQALPMLRLPVPLRAYEQDLSILKHAAATTNGYDELVGAIDMFLVHKKHRAVYDRPVSFITRLKRLLGY